MPRSFLSILFLYLLSTEMSLLKLAAAGVASGCMIPHDSNLDEGAGLSWCHRALATFTLLTEVPRLAQPLLQVTAVVVTQEVRL